MSNGFLVVNKTRVNEFCKFVKILYTSRSYGYGIYGELILVESKALKQAHSNLCNCFSNAAIGTKSAVRNPQPWPCEVYITKNERFKKII
jgi:hypothetical protein